MAQDYVRLAVFKTRRMAFKAPRVLQDHGLVEVSVWPVHTSAYGYIDRRHIVMIAGDRVGEARRLLTENGLWSRVDLDP